MENTCCRIHANLVYETNVIDSPQQIIPHESQQQGFSTKTICPHSLHSNLSPFLFATNDTSQKLINHSINKQPNKNNPEKIATNQSIEL
jgi:hypothetical protein